MKAAPLRERQRELTRNAILDAYLELAHVDGASAISIPAVARTAGVSPRTIYRYFPTKGELATAAALRMSTEALAGDDMYASTTSNLGDNLKRLWFGLNEQLPAVIAEHATPAGRDIRRTRLDMARAAVRDRIDAGIDAESVDLIIAVTSSSMFLELVDRMGHSPEVASAIATRGANLVIADALKEAK